MHKLWVALKELSESRIQSRILHERGIISEGEVTGVYRGTGQTLDMFAQGRPTDWRNRRIWGDKKYVLPSLLPESAFAAILTYFFR